MNTFGIYLLWHWLFCMHFMSLSKVCLPLPSRAYTWEWRASSNANLYEVAALWVGQCTIVFNLVLSMI